MVLFSCIICSSILFSFYLQNSVEDEQIERFFSESDQYMIQRDEPMTLEFDEETRSFPCRKCGHLFYSAKALQNHDITSHGNEKYFFC